MRLVKLLLPEEDQKAEDNGSTVKENIRQNELLMSVCS